MKHSNDEMKRIVLVGGGGHCRSVLDTLNRSNDYGEILITDSNIPAETVIDGATVLGNDDILPNLFVRGISNAFVTIGSVGARESDELRQKLYENVKSLGFAIPYIIDSSAIVSNSSQIAEGVYIGKNAVINAGAKIDKMAIINTGAIVEHECKIGAYSHVSIGAVLAGRVEVGEGTFIGANSTIIQCIKIGANSVIGAGSVVLGDVPDNTTVVGVYNGHK